jgi:IS5 family transposase
MAAFLAFAEGNVFYIPDAKDEKDDVQLSDEWLRAVYSFTLEEYTMNEQAIAIFCICDELVKSYGLSDHSTYKMTTAEVMTFAIISALHYHADYRLTRLVVQGGKYFSKILSHSHLIRRIHAIPESLWLMIFYALRMYLRKSESEYFIVDSLPIKAYENYKSFRAKLFRGKEFHGYTASKKHYFFGIKIHMIVDAEGIPIEFCFTPGGTSDIGGLKELPCELPKGSILFADKAYNGYSLEDDMREMVEINLVARRRKNLIRQHSPSLEFILNNTRNRIETVFSSIISRMPRYIRARTEKGFYLKITFFIIAYLFNIFVIS